ncbi:unnamed protein product [Cuscuta europaea]|uniref:Uncharacterized protein n=1 Tax=Cuscuta europaea TaxID=41803 RepID=A0A9P0ZTE8_CUSEU|nr:unnamed protein product [Cuscuta europaea]
MATMAQVSSKAVEADLFNGGNFCLALEGCFDFSGGSSNFCPAPGGGGGGGGSSMATTVQISTISSSSRIGAPEDTELETTGFLCIMALLYRIIGDKCGFGIVLLWSSRYNSDVCCQLCNHHSNSYLFLVNNFRPREAEIEE